MGIESLEKIRKLSQDFYEGGAFREHNRLILVDNFMQTTIDTLKDQSDEIANLRQELAKKEDVIEVNNIKEVRNLNGR